MKNKDNKVELKDNVNKKVMMHIVSILIVLFVLSPILVRLLISFNVLNDVTNDWIGFYGNYFGTIISLGISLFILYMNRLDNKETNRQTQIDNDKNQKLLLKSNKDIINNSVKPVINAWHIEGTYGDAYKRSRRKYDYVHRDNGKFITWLDYERSNDYIDEKYFNTELAIENVGVGPIINLEVQFIGNGALIKSDERITINKDGSIIYKLFIQDYLISANGNKVNFKYQDIYGNKFKQYIDFGARENEYDKWCLTKFGHISLQNNDND